MSETLRFQVARGVNRRRPSTADTLHLFEHTIDPMQLFNPDIELAPYVPKGPMSAPEVWQLVQAATTWRDDPALFVDPERPQTPTEPGNPGTPRDFAAFIDLLRALDQWLVAKGNRPEVDELIQCAALKAAKLVDVVEVDGCQSAELILAALINDPLWSKGWDFTRRSFCALLAAPPSNDEAASRAAARLQRLLLVRGLLQALTDEGLRPKLADGVLRLLHDCIVVVPSPPFPIVDVERESGRRRARVAERAGFGDLWVVRGEWACYQPGEIAHIENVLKGERRERVHKRIDETEVTETSETETTRTSQLDTQTTDRFEVTEEASTDISLAIRADAQVDLSAQYGTTKLEAHGAGSLDWSVEESRRHASQVAQESVERAVHRVEERVREERVKRTLTRIIETNTHEINNSKQPNGHVVGVYRWVDKIQRLQLFRHPNRYLLEFQIPEPAAFLRWLQGRDSGPKPLTPEPPHFTSDEQPLKEDRSNQLTMSSFQPTDYGSFAARYRANVEPPPEPTIWISGSAAIKLQEPQDTSKVPTLAVPPTASETINLAVPPGYAAVAAIVSATGTPVHADWLDHPEGWDVGANSDGWDDRDGYHIIRAEATLAGKRIALYPTNTKTVEPSTDVAMPEYVDAWLSLASAEEFLESRPEQQVSVGVTMAGTYKGSVSVALKCQLLPSTLEQWRLDTYTALRDAYQSWQAQYDNEKRAMQVRAGIVIEGSSPARNLEVIREELKRQVIEMLFGHRFIGLPAVDRPEELRPEVNLDKALDAAPYVQFLEQVFEWDKMTYVLYPYYWAQDSEWERLQPIDGADPDFARFLRSGSARVVVAARPGYANAVNHWLWFGRPWGGGPAPTPDQDGYISIADEIRALNQAPDEGQPEASWEVRLPTNLIWLDPDPTLPKANPAMRLTAPANPQGRLCQPTANGGPMPAELEAAHHV